MEFVIWLRWARLNKNLCIRLRRAIQEWNCGLRLNLSVNICRDWWPACLFHVGVGLR